jgi:FG-GAP-like repeat
MTRSSRGVIFGSSSCKSPVRHFLRHFRRNFPIAVVILLFASASLAQQFNVGMFRPWPGYSIPNGIWLTGDFNGDGKADIFHAVANTDYANVWLSYGDGSFNVQSFRPWSGYSIPNGVWLTGDFNGDGKTDVFHAVADTDYANIWFSLGNGTFNVQSFSPWPGYSIPNGVWLTGDFNGDGKTDVFHAVAGTDYANIWFSNGDGTFNVKSFSPWNGYSIPNGIWLVGDFNGDGKADIFHAVDGADYANIWFSNGDGTFNVKSFRPWNGYAIPNGVWLVGDFNGDGKSDIFHAVADTDYANIWLSNGDGTFNVQSFRPWSGYAIPNGVWIVGDFNGDGKSDVFHAVADTDYANIWLSNGNGTFNVTSFSPWNGYAIPNGLWLPLDITGDGKTDVVHAVASGDYVHPWISLLANPRQLFQQGLEVSQAVQSLAEDVPLVTGKSTIVRAYFDAPAGGEITVQGNLTVRDVATGAVSTVNSSAAVALNPAQNGQLATRRNSLALSLNFALPAALSSAGTRDFSLTNVVNTAGGQSIVCSNCSAGTVRVAFSNSAPMRVRMVGLRYNTGIPPATVVNQPAAADFNLLASWLGRAYPVPQVNSTQTTVLSNNGWPFGCGQANAQLQAMRATEVASGTDSRTHYIGLVSNGGGFMRGCSSGIPSGADPSTVASAPTGNPAGPGPVPVNVAGDTDASFGDWYGGHELGHTFGRSHPGFCNGNSADDSNFPYPNGQISDNADTYVGWDKGDATNGVAAAALPGTTTFDIMTYCNQPQWLSAYTYRGIHDRLNAEDPSGSGAGGGGSGGGAGERRGNSFVTPSGIEFPLGCACPHVKPARETPVQPHLGHEKPLTPKLGREEMPASPRPAGEKPVLQKKEPHVPNPPPAAKKAARVNRLVTLPSAAPQETPTAIQTELKEGRFVSLIATLNLTRRTGQILYVNHVHRAMVTVRVVEGRVVLRLRDRSGKTLYEAHEIARENTDIPPREDRTALVAAVIPEMQKVGLVELLLDGKVVDRIEVPSEPPSVGDLQTNYEKEKGELSITWKGKAAPQGEKRLRFLVEYSPDGQNDWQTLAVGSVEPRILLSGEEARRFSGGVLRITANDGYNDSHPAFIQLASSGDRED